MFLMFCTKFGLGVKIEVYAIWVLIFVPVNWFLMMIKLKTCLWCGENKTECAFTRTLLTLIAPIFRVNHVFERTNPRTGIWSTWYLLRRTDGIPSTAFLILVSFLYSSVDNFLKYWALATVLGVIVTTAYFFRFFTRQALRFLQLLQCSFRKNIR